MSFNSLSLSSAVIDALPAAFTTPTEIQSKAIPALLSQRDVLAQANTGSGKTLAFGLPLIEQILTSATSQRGLVLAPTRELALQIEKTLSEISAVLNIHTLCLCGGVEKQTQIAALTNAPQILVATTGRLLDLVDSGDLDLSRFNFLILDEADRLLDMGFWDDVQRIASLISPKRQTAMFSATFSAQLKDKAEQLLYRATHIAVHQENSVNQDIAEQLYLVNKGSKTNALIAQLKQHAWSQVLVFISAKENADSLVKKLSKAGFPTLALHGNKTQQEREQALDAFKRGKIQVLIATDVLARGVHIDHLPVVINFDLPSHAEVYVHRVGRTARAGQQGMAMSLVCHGEAQALEAIRQLTQRALVLETLADFPVTDKPSTGESKRAPRDKKANRRTQNKRSVKQFQQRKPA
uniref:DEAD/DEAH box helicase n=1 Tax=Thaumasiovibrio occultus TaxID=1891184 RepID=UPI000B35D508|nr:DEAD/DEAH box helicase [Thaumasiovibrio occultus]